MSQNTAKAMAYIMNVSGGDFQQGDCLYKSTSGIQWTPEHSWTSDRPQKQASEKPTSQLLHGSGVIISWLNDRAISIVDEKRFYYCVHMWWVFANPFTYSNIAN